MNEAVSPRTGKQPVDIGAVRFQGIEEWKAQHGHGKGPGPQYPTARDTVAQPRRGQEPDG